MARPIDAYTLNNDIVSWYNDTEDEKEKSILRRVMQRVLQAPTLTPPNEWVSVGTDMPPEHEPVLCIVSGKPRSNITLDEAYQLGSWNKADGWIIDEWPEWEDANVSWWCELPEPPDRRPQEREDNETK